MRGVVAREQAGASARRETCGETVLLLGRSAAHAGARSAGTGVHDLRRLEARLGARARSGTSHQRARRGWRGRQARQARRDGEGGAARARHDLHPLLHVERRGTADDRRHRRHGVDRGAGRDADGTWDAADSAMSRPWPPSEPERGRRNDGVRGPVRPDAFGAHAAAMRRSTNSGWRGRRTCLPCSAVAT